MLAAALEAEVDAYIAALADERDERGRRLVVRNGHAGCARPPLRQGSGSMWLREWTTDKAPVLTRALPVPQLGSSHAVGAQFSEGDRGVAVDVLARQVVGRLRAGAGRVLRFGCWPVGVVITRLTTQWQAEQRALRPIGTRQTGTTCVACGPMVCFRRPAG